MARSSTTPSIRLETPLLAGLLLGGCFNPPVGQDSSFELEASSTGGSTGTDRPPPATTGTSGTTGTDAADDGGSTSSSTSAGVDVDTGLRVDLPPERPDLGPEDGCVTDPAADEDEDGFSVRDGDCNDCDPAINPGAIEVEVTEPDDMGMVPEPVDDDCDGLIDNVPLPCDAGLALESTDPYDAAAAIGLCKTSAGEGDWGLVNAQFVRADGTPMVVPLQHGLMTGFGPNLDPREGEQLLVLSSGHARIPGQTNACGSLTCNTSGPGTAPVGFPQDVPGCAGLSEINDDIALEVTLRPPTNAAGYAFSFDFYSFEYPEWVCTSFNDQFIALADPPPRGSIDGNISFDSMANPVSVNIAFFEVCQGCPLGIAELEGTGFDVWDDAGATSWLTTTAPVDPAELLTLRFVIWDTGDQAWDSTVLLDGFRWITEGPVMVGTET